jgi:hypothetical protein
MLKLEDFETLALAQAYEFTNDKKRIGSGQARGYLIRKGLWSILRAMQADLNNPLSSLADGTIITASDANSHFGLDPSKADGIGNLQSVGVFVSEGVFTQEQADKFLNLAISIENVYANKTLLDFKIAKGTIERVKVTQLFERGECVIITTADCEAHTPQIYERVRRANGKIEDIRIAGFRTVEKEGTYRTHCRDVNNLWIDNAYGVITA